MNFFTNLAKVTVAGAWIYIVVVALVLGTWFLLYHIGLMLVDPMLPYLEIILRGYLSE